MNRRIIRFRLIIVITIDLIAETAAVITAELIRTIIITISVAIEATDLAAETVIGVGPIITIVVVIVEEVVIIIAVLATVIVAIVEVEEVLLVIAAVITIG
jgi:hypothetical protein